MYVCLAHTSHLFPENQTFPTLEIVGRFLLWIQFSRWTFVDWNLLNYENAWGKYPGEKCSLLTSQNVNFEYNLYTVNFKRRIYMWLEECAWSSIKCTEMSFTNMAPRQVASLASCAGEVASPARPSQKGCWWYWGCCGINAVSGDLRPVFLAKEYTLVWELHRLGFGPQDLYFQC